MAKGLSWHALAVTAGVSARTIYDGLSGKRDWRGETVKKLAAAVGLDLSDLVIDVHARRDRKHATSSAPLHEQPTAVRGAVNSSRSKGGRACA
ncbi:MAG: helix-turn-helix transcriptional regulator [Phycisphaerales bacterium]|nr:helix-turn-helix transcriptional regulator [Phycisphaerales bacterium]